MWLIGLAILVGIIALVIGMKWTRKRELKEVEKFKSGPQTESEVYLDTIGVKPGTPDAEMVLGIRSIIAELGQIPAESVKPEHRLWKDFQKLPFFDSPDTLEFIMMIEDIFKINIADKAAGNFFSYDENLTVKEFTLRILQYFQQEKLKEKSN
ncbi:MAG: hypothetical protein JW860_03065 [Sedimentisphaerales bacterium]|nr:hypothetical protein [Sedimentisphaerales bacterium]